MNKKATSLKPSYELINPPGSSSILYREHGSPDPLIRWHYHKEYELHLITHGAGKVLVGDYIGNFYPGHLILTGPNLAHNWMTQHDEVLPERDKLITFPGELLQSFKTVFPEVSQLDPLLKRAHFGVEFSDKALIAEAHMLINEVAKEEGLLRVAAFLKLMVLLSQTEDYKLLSSEQYHQVSSEKNQARVNQVVSYIANHYKRNLIQEEVANHFGMQPTYFSRFFRRATGKRFVEFVNNLRIARACDLITHSDLQITAICFEVGFNNIANFNRHFHALKGMTPSDYRKCVNDAYKVNANRSTPYTC